MHRFFPRWLLLVSMVSVTLGATTTIPGRAADVSSSDWTQWRGPKRDGQVSNSVWPATLSEENVKKRWRVQLGPSYSGPIVVGDRVFVTETKDKKLEVVRALDRSTGKQLWEASWEGSMTVPFFARSNGDWIRSTPAFDDGKLYVAGMKDVLTCLDASDGKIVWQVDFVKELGTPVPDFGFVCSPLIDGDFVYVQAGAALSKVDKRTGKIVWRTLKDEGGMNGSAFSSPIFATLGGVRQLLVQTRTDLAGVDAGDGRVLWTKAIPAFRGMNILTPTVIGDAIFTSTYGGKSLLLGVSKKDDTWTVDEKWEYKAEGYMSSPVIVDGHAYLHLRNQRVACINLQTGAAAWTTRPYGKYWSLVANDKKILALDANGTLMMLQANPEKFDLLSTVKLSEEETWAHLAVSGSQIFVRELNAISAWDWQSN